jgi:hypothetical protein
VGGGGEPQALEMRLQRVEQTQAANFRRLLAWGAPVTAVVAAGVPLVHFGAVVLVPFMVAAHLILVRLVLVREAQRYLRPVRRFLNRWTIRFSFLWIGLPGYGAMTVPFLGVAVGAGAFVVLTTIAHIVTAVSLQKERSGEPLSRWEKIVPATLAVLTVVLVILLIGLAGLFGWTVAAIAERMQTP